MTELDVRELKEKEYIPYHELGTRKLLPEEKMEERKNGKDFSNWQG